MKRELLMLFSLKDTHSREKKKTRKSTKPKLTWKIKHRVSKIRIQEGRIQHRDNVYISSDERK